MESRSKWLLPLLLLVPGVSAWAADGSIPIPFTAGPPPYVITAPGHYIVTRPLSIATDNNIIRIFANDVDLDLNGMVLDSVSGFASVIWASGEGLTIRHGTVRGGKHGIEVVDAARVVIEDVQSQDADQAGIFLSNADGFALRRNNILLPGQWGIAIGGPFPVSGKVEDNQVRTPTNGFMFSNLLGAEISHNRIRRIGPQDPFGGNGILLEGVSGSLVSDNVVEGPLGLSLGVAPLGYTGGDGNKVIDNVISDGKFQGILIATHGNLVLNNVVSHCGGPGLYVDGDNNHIEGNVLSRNVGFGLQFHGYFNVYRRNMARGNAGASCAGTGTTDFCDEATGNASAGDNFLPGLM